MHGFTTNCKTDMQNWLLLGLIGYLFYAISTTIDKYILKHKFGFVRMEAFKMFFDGMVLLIIGIIFFDLSLNKELLYWTIPLGAVNAGAGLFYYKALQQRDSEEITPAHRSGSILLVFLASILFLSETIHPANYLGLILLLAGIYVIRSKDGFHFPPIDKVFVLVMLVVFFDVIYALTAKQALATIQPINLAILMYFMTALTVIIYDTLNKKHRLNHFYHFRKNIKLTSFSALFAATGTLLIYTALTYGNASQVFPLAAAEPAVLFIFATIFLKEQFSWHRLLGTLFVLAGIIFVAI